MQPDRDPFRRGRIIPNVIAVGFIVLVVLFAYWNATAQAATAVDGRCGMTRLARVIPWTTHYHVRIGVKVSGGRLLCDGTVAQKSGRASIQACCSWFPFSLPSWHWSHILIVRGTDTGTGAACATFGVALLGELPSGLFDTAVTGASAAGCVAGWYEVSQQAYQPNEDPHVVFGFIK